MVMARCELLNILNYCNEIFYSPWLSLGPDHPQSQQYGRGPILEPAAVILHQKFRWNKQKWWQWQNDKIDDGSVSPGQEGRHYQGSHRQADTWSQEVQLWAFYILIWYYNWCWYFLSRNLGAAKKYMSTSTCIGSRQGPCHAREACQVLTYDEVNWSRIIIRRFVKSF